MKSTLFASTLASALTSTSFGQVEVELVDECCPPGVNVTYVDQVLTFDNPDNFGYTEWTFTVPSDTWVSYSLSWLSEYYDAGVFDWQGGGIVFGVMEYEWLAKGRPDTWSGSFFLPQGTYNVKFSECEGSIDFNYEPGPQGSCCVNSGCTSTEESACDELGGTWTEGGSCDDCEPVADDCPADVDGDGSIGFSDVLIILNDWGACP